MFESLHITGSGMGVHKAWMNAISDNLANMNNITATSESAFQARYVIAQAMEDGEAGAGVTVAGIERGSDAGRLVYNPQHPLADANGLVRMPDIDMGEQMSTMIMAQRGYQANISQLQRVQASYQAAINMGRG